MSATRIDGGGWVVWAQRLARRLPRPLVDRAWNALPDGARLSLQRHVFAVAVGMRGRRGRVVPVPAATVDEAAASAAASPRASVVVVTHTQRDHCIACLDALVHATSGVAFEVVVVDNGADDDGRRALRDAVARLAPVVRLIENDRNVGFAPACNQGIRASKGEIVVLLNDDTVVTRGWLDRLVDALERNPRAGVVCPVTNEIDNAARVETAYTTLEELDAYAAARAERESGRTDTVERVALFCAAMRRSVLDEIGLLDERYEVGMFEDDDLSQALHAKRYVLVIARDAFVHHVGHASFSLLDDAQYLAIWTANRRRFEQKWNVRWSPPPGARRRVELGPRGPVAGALAIYLFLIAAYFMPPATWNPAAHLALTRALVERASFDIGPDASLTGDHVRIGDRTYATVAPLPALLAAPVLAARSVVTHRSAPPPDANGRRALTSNGLRRALYACSIGTSGAAFAWLGVALYLVLRRRHGEHLACVSVIAAMLGTPLLAYGTTFFGHATAAAFLFGAWALAFDGARRRAWRLVAAGLCLGASVGCEYVCAAPALFLAAAAVMRARGRWRWSVLRSLVAGAAPPLAALAAYLTICFGAPWRTGGGLALGAPRPAAMAAMLGGTTRGLFYVAPLAAAGLAGLAWLGWRGATNVRPQARARIAFGAFAVLLVAASALSDWTGGSAFGPRHLVPALGLLGVGVPYAFASARWRPLAIALAILSTVVVTTATAIGVEAPPDVDVLGAYVWPALRDGRLARLPGASNWGIELGLGRGASLVPVFAWIVGGAVWLLLHCRPTVKEEAERAPEREERQETRQPT